MPNVTHASDEPNSAFLKKNRYKHTLRKSPYFVSLILLLLATALTILNIYVPDLIRVKVSPPGPVSFETRYGLYRRCTRSSPYNTTTAFLAPSQPLPEPIHFDPSARLLASRGEVVFSHAAAEENDGERPGVPGGDGPIEEKPGGWVCQSFPTRSECAEFGETFCVIWSTAGYLAQSSLVPCLVALFSLMFIFLHRGQRTARARARRQQWKLVSGTMLVHFLLQVVSASLILHVFRTDARFHERGSRLHKSFTFGVCSAVVSGIIAGILTFTGMAARAGKPWAAGKSARRARRHRRTRSGRVVPVPEGQPIPQEEVVTVGEVEAAKAVVEDPDERTGLLAGGSRSGSSGGYGARGSGSGSGSGSK